MDLYQALRAKRRAGQDTAAERAGIRAYWVGALKLKDNPHKSLNTLLDEHDHRQAQLAAVAEAEGIVAEAQGIRRRGGAL